MALGLGVVKMKRIAVALLAAACSRNHVPSTMTSTTNGWTMLDNAGAWRSFDSDAIPAGWTFSNNVLSKQRGTGDLITKQQFANFELALDWKIGSGGNSGIFYRGTKDYNHIYWSAPEYQLEDNIGADDNKSPDRWTAANYALYPPSSGKVPTADKWNTTRLVVNGAHVEHWLNGQKVVEYELWSDEWKAKVAASKFHAYPLYGLAKRGYIGIQGDHPGTLTIRNIRIRELP
jgi:hypothetical protein